MSLATLTAADQRIRQLGDSMFEMLANQGECTDALLRAEGYSSHELVTYGDAARTYANQRFVRDIAAEGFTRTDEEITAIAVGAATGALGDAQIVNAMLAAGLRPGDIERNWTKITRKLGVSIGTLAKPAFA